MKSHTPVAVIGGGLPLVTSQDRMDFRKAERAALW